MKTAFALTFLLGVSTALIPRSPLHDTFQAWKAKFGKVYESEAEELTRLRNFEANAYEVLHHNMDASMGKHGYTLELNRLADLNEEEFEATMLMPEGSLAPEVPMGEIFNAEAIDMSALPDSVDWRKHGYVTPVKNQGQCGSCWSFAATGALEGAWYNKSGSLEVLSEQQQVSCNTGEGGCDGGWPEGAFDYWITVRGAVSEASYPYTSGAHGDSGQCQDDRGEVVAKMRGYKRVPRGDEDALRKSSATVGPISIAINAPKKMMLYSSGVFYKRFCGKKMSNLTHAVLLVGYGTDEETGKEYWLVKNSWSEEWGEKGYIRMARNRRNNCGVATRAVFPIV